MCIRDSSRVVRLFLGERQIEEASYTRRWLEVDDVEVLSHVLSALSGEGRRRGPSFAAEYVAMQLSVKGQAVALGADRQDAHERYLSLIHISEPTRLLSISYAVFCLKKKK